MGENEAYPHGEIFKACDKFLYGFSIPKIPVPKFAAKIGAKVLLKLNPEEFIHPWMINLSDEYFSFEMNETKESTGWRAEQYIGENINKMLKHMKDDEGEFTKRTPFDLGEGSLETVVTGPALVDGPDNIVLFDNELIIDRKIVDIVLSPKFLKGYRNRRQLRTSFCRWLGAFVGVTFAVMGKLTSLVTSFIVTFPNAVPLSILSTISIAVLNLFASKKSSFLCDRNFVFHFPSRSEQSIESISMTNFAETNFLSFISTVDSFS